MAFVFTLCTDDFLIKSVEKIGEGVATLDIGYDDEDRTTFKALVALVPVPARPPNFRELFFQIIESGEDEVIEDYRSGLRTKSFLTGDDRSLVLNAICQLARHMVERFEVEVLVINTIETHLPGKALLKYSKICEAICESGYKAGMVDAYHGQEQWQIIKI